MTAPLFKTPPVHYTASGAPYVDPVDILLSQAGQEEIFKAAELEVSAPKKPKPPNGSSQQ